jgi:very-short-patch-repair endonuclease
MKVPPKISDSAVERARELRKNSTEAELALWEIIRDRKLGNCKFYRQRPIYYKDNDKIFFYIADFCCDEWKFVIEVDGGYHYETKEQDELRDEILGGMGYQTIRFTNHQILNDKDKCVKTIIETIMKLKEK